jgi:predicted hotdog family 3-hydroxylacyl-ACP dehydratase
MEQEHIVPAESLIPHRGGMKLLERVINPGSSGLQAETTVAQSWPLSRDGSVSSLLCVELVAQAISALSTWRRGEGARPRPGLLVGIKEAQFFTERLPMGAGLSIRVDELYHVGSYAVFKGEVACGSALCCSATIQVMEPEEDDFLNQLKKRGSHSAAEGTED